MTWVDWVSISLSLLAFAVSVASCVMVYRDEKEIRRHIKRRLEDDA